MSENTDQAPCQHCWHEDGELETPLCSLTGPLAVMAVVATRTKIVVCCVCGLHTWRGGLADEEVSHPMKFWDEYELAGGENDE